MALSAMVSLAAGGAWSAANRSDTAVSGGGTKIRVQDRTVPDPLEQMARARGLRLQRGAAIVTQIGEISESELHEISESSRDTSPRSACKTVALSGGGGNTACKRVNARGEVGEPLVSVTVLGNERYAVSALLPPGAGRVRLGSRSGDTEQEVRSSKRMFGLRADYRDIGTLRYEAAEGEARSVDLRQLAEDAAEG